MDAIMKTIIYQLNRNLLKNIHMPKMCHTVNKAINLDYLQGMNSLIGNDNYNLQ